MAGIAGPSPGIALITFNCPFAIAFRTVYHAKSETRST